MDINLREIRSLNMKPWNEIYIYFKDGTTLKFTPEQLENAKLMKQAMEILKELA